MFSDFEGSTVWRREEKEAGLARKTGNKNEPWLIPQNSPARLNPKGQRFIPPGYWVSLAGGQQRLITEVVSVLAKDDSLEKAATGVIRHSQ